MLPKFEDWNILELYQEERDSTFTHDNHEYDLNKLLRSTTSNSISEFPIRKLKWILDHTKIDPRRIENANYDFPILIAKWHDKYVVIDGVHRLSKAIQMAQTRIKVKIVSAEQLSACLIK